MSAVLKKLSAKATDRLMKRPATPEIEIGQTDGSWEFQSPYHIEDHDDWEALLFDAFATRSAPAFHAFTTQLSHLCSTEWRGDQQTWNPVQWELRAAIQIVRSLRPRNEAEACLAAQMVAVHLMQLKLSAQALNNGYPEPRSCAIAGKLARTYAMQLETMARLKGKGTRQRITVRKTSTHEHRHIDLHQGDIENGDQPHGPRGAQAAEIKAVSQPESCAALLSPHASGHALPMPSDHGKNAVSSSRRSRRSGGANRHR
ncbi:hypothetical protein LZ016_10565 [Sphingomonas sp. SM33]|uniref:Uncharacterized protein n=1 Tax=Sphingomonas telluris TaxID=2907998 RepID=A0ABS9VNI5_9SPHN|nr:hypothetical protein [Sphingomonas telluris]MCH8616540.1 hypothetical protein [Sphingomonas telluris]